MKWPRVVLMLLGIVGVCGSVESAAAPPVPLAGRWKLNRELSEFPKEVAFGIDTTDGDTPPSGRQSGGNQGAGGRRGGGRSKAAGSGGGAGFSIQSVRESEEDVNKIKELIADARNPSTILTISQTDTAVVITDWQDRTRAFHPTGKEETAQLDSGPIGATAKWSGPQLSVQFTVRSDRIFRYVYSRLPGGQLLVETRLEEGRSRGEKAEVIRRVYDSE
ncbi:MAG: hypothetical protein ABJA98_15165 [Acidobacteriota bacterium]